MSKLTKTGKRCIIRLTELEELVVSLSIPGSARHSHCRGQGFDSPMLHKKTLQIKVCKVFSCSFFSRSEYADTAQLPLVYYSRVFFCRVRSLPSVSAGHTRLANTPRILRLIIPFSLVTGFGGCIAIVCRV